jgi:hypothetical protein
MLVLGMKINATYSQTKRLVDTKDFTTLGTYSHARIHSMLSLSGIKRHMD